MTFYHSSSTHALLNRAAVGHTAVMPSGGQTSFGRNYAAPGHAAFAGQRNRFSIGTDDTGRPNVALDDGESATVVVGADGSVTISVSKPPAAPPAPTNGEAAFRTARGRHVQRVVTTSNADGSVLITPDGDEVLTITDTGSTSGLVVVEVTEEVTI